MGSIRVAWWNLQNLFDTDDDPISDDLEFTVDEGWTPEVYAAKKANLATVLRQIHGGQPPELLGVAEIEGDDVFAELDARRRAHLAEVAQAAEQVVVTAAVAADVPEQLKGVQFDVHEGQVRRVR